MKNLLKVTPLKLSLVLSLLLAGLVFGQEQYGWNEWLPYRLELKILDAKFLYRGPRPLEPAVVIAAGDEKALEQFGVWGSWPRDVYAKMLRNLFAAGADVVAFDMVWADEMKTDTFAAVNRLRKEFADAGFGKQALAARQRVEKAQQRLTRLEQALAQAQKGAKAGAAKKALAPLVSARNATAKELAQALAAARAMEEATEQFDGVLEAAASGGADDELEQTLSDFSSRVVLGYIAEAGGGATVPPDRDVQFERIRSAAMDQMYRDIRKVNGTPGGRLARTLVEMCHTKGTCELGAEDVGLRAGMAPEVLMGGLEDLAGRGLLNVTEEGLTISDTGPLKEHADNAKDAALLEWLPGTPWRREGIEDQRHNVGVQRIHGDLFTPLAKFADVSQNFGFYSASPDQDGVFRRQPLLYRYTPDQPTQDEAKCTACNRERLTPAAYGALEDPGVCSQACVESCPDCLVRVYYLSSLALATLQQRRGNSVVPLHDANYDTPIIDRVALLPFEPVPREAPPPVKLATDQHGALLLNFYGKWADPETGLKLFPHISVADLVNNTFDKDLVRGKAVIFAVTALGTYDQRSTPFDGFAPGVALHATALQNMVDGSFLSRPATQLAAEMLFMLFMALLLGLLLPRMPVWAAVALVLALVVTYWLVDVHVLFARGLWVQTFWPNVQLFATLIIVLGHGYLTVGREKAAMRKAFGACLDPMLVDELSANPDTIKKLKGDEREATCMFSDIRGFTTLSENLTPEELTVFLNEYFTAQAEAIMLHKGYLDKYIGDAIMALFGAPSAFADHAISACHAAIDMMEQLHIFKRYVLADPKWAAFCQRLLSKQMDPASFDIGIGLNSGLMRVGYMGSQQRTNYSALGDAVNLASRLEGQTKEYGAHIIIGESTYAQAKGAIYARLLDAIRVKGKKEPVRIYEVLGKGEAPPEWAAFIKSFETGIELFQTRQFADAIPHFAQALREKPMDAAYEEDLKKKGKPRDLISAEYISRCMMYQENPPPVDWDGVVTKTSK